MRGRYPAGLDECIDELDGTAEEKQRLHLILDTLVGEARLFESCAALGIGETRFRQLRRLVFQGALDALKRKTPGRPSQTTTGNAPEVAELQRRLADKELELQEMLVREEVALILPRAAAAAEKKTLRTTRKRRRRKPR